MSKVQPHSISYIECHATATNIGDAIEAMGLVQAYERLMPPPTEPANIEKTIALGSIKGNIGHANAAAGVTGFIKTVLMLHHKKLVPTANLEQISDKVSNVIERSPFYVNLGGVEDWTTEPLRAGVSSFGIGGANSHCILEAYDNRKKHMTAESNVTQGVGGFHLLTLSAKTESSLRASMKQLASHLDRPNSYSEAQVAYSLSATRENFQRRFSLPIASLSEASELLQSSASIPFDDSKTLTSMNAPSVVMVFPGQGSQYLRMGQDFYDDNSFVGKKFRSILFECSTVAEPILGLNFLDYLYPSPMKEDTDPAACIEHFNRPSIIQPSLFAVEYALARILILLGLKPVAVAGHSVGVSRDSLNADANKSY